MNKKIAREIIKEKLDKSEEFREYYNNLEEDEKEEVRKEITNHKEITDSIRESNTVTYECLRDQVVDLYHEEIFAKGFKKANSKKAKIYATSKLFFFKLHDKYHVSVRAIPHKKGTEFELKVLIEVPSTSGRLYARLENSPRIIFTGHFFDRYAERLELTGTRDEIVEQYLKESFKERGVAAIEPTKDVTIRIVNGLGLGTILVDLILVKTFIANTQSSRHQKEIRTNMEEHLLALVA